MGRNLYRGMHWTYKGQERVPKKGFETLDEALAFIRHNFADPDAMAPYVCNSCGMWHIGHRI